MISPLSTFATTSFTGVVTATAVGFSPGTFPSIIVILPLAVLPENNCGCPLDLTGVGDGADSPPPNCPSLPFLTTIFDHL